VYKFRRCYKQFFHFIKERGSERQRGGEAITARDSELQEQEKLSHAKSPSLTLNIELLRVIYFLIKLMNVVCLFVCLFVYSFYGSKCSGGRISLFLLTLFVISGPFAVALLLHSIKEREERF